MLTQPFLSVLEVISNYRRSYVWGAVRALVGPNKSIIRIFLGPVKAVEKPF